MPITSKPSRSRHQVSCSSILRSQGGVFKESRSPLMRTGTSRISAKSLVSLRVVDSLHHSRSPCHGWIRTSVPGWSSGVSLSPMVKVPSARPIHKIVGASGVFAERERTSTVSATRNQESRPMPNWQRICAGRRRSRPAWTSRRWWPGASAFRHPSSRSRCLARPSGRCSRTAPPRSPEPTRGPGDGVPRSHPGHSAAARAGRRARCCTDDG